MNDVYTRTNLTCTQCGYLLDGINLRENCPECGKRIVNGCYWCDYDLSNTAPDSVCPECGIPVTASIGSGILVNAPVDVLRSVHAGFKIVTILILIYIITSIAAGVIATTMMATTSNTTIYFTILVGSIVNNGIILAIVYGWWKLSQPIPGLPVGITGRDKRSLLRTVSWIFAGVTALSLILNLVPQNYSPTAATTSLGMVNGILSLFSLVIMLLYFIAQVRYVGWIAKLVRNRKMERRSKHLVWSGPLIAILGFFLLFLGPLIVLILYWNMIEYTRRDLKKIINTIERSKPIGA